MKTFRLFPLILLALAAGCTTPKPTPVAQPAPVATRALPTETTAPTATVMQQAEVVEATEVAESIELYTLRMVSVADGWGLAGQPGELQQIVRTSDGGRSWRVMGLPMEVGTEPSEFTLTAAFLDTRNALVVPFRLDEVLPAEQVVWATEDGGNTWSMSTFLLDGSYEGFHISHLQFIDAQYGWLLAHVGAGMNHDYIALYRTVDGGVSWNLVLNPFNDTSGVMGCRKNDILFTDPDSGWLTGTCDGVAAGVLLFRTTDGGVNWSAVDLPEPAGKPGIYADFSMVCASQFPAVNGGNFMVEVACRNMDDQLAQPLVWLYSIANGGADWQVRDVSAGMLTVLEDGSLLIQGDRNLLYPAGSGDPMVLSEMPEGTRVHFTGLNEGWMLAANGRGIYHTMDGARTWELILPVP